MNTNSSDLQEAIDGVIEEGISRVDNDVDLGRR